MMPDCMESPNDRMAELHTAALAPVEEIPMVETARKKEIMFFKVSKDIPSASVIRIRDTLNNYLFPARACVLCEGIDLYEPKKTRRASRSSMMAHGWIRK
jgi:hypothetical protein